MPDQEPVAEPGRQAHAASTSAGSDTPAPTAARPFAELPADFGRYHVLRPLGQGGMGWVYLAEDRMLQRPVALKIPRFQGGDEPAQVERFYREARVAATFTHPHLCPVYDVGQVNGVHYLAMRFLEGEPLSAWLRREGRPSPRTAARPWHSSRETAVALSGGTRPMRRSREARSSPSMYSIDRKTMPSASAMS